MDMEDMEVMEDMELINTRLILTIVMMKNH